MGQLKILKEQVERVLDEIPETRNNDKTLYIEIIKKYYSNFIITSPKGKQYIRIEKLLKLPSQGNGSIIIDMVFRLQYNAFQVAFRAIFKSGCPRVETQGEAVRFGGLSRPAVKRVAITLGATMVSKKNTLQEGIL